MEIGSAVLERVGTGTGTTSAEQSVEGSGLVVREERRQLTRKYRGLIKRFEELKSAPEENTLASLTEGVTEASNLFSKVKGTYEASLDSKVLLLTSELGCQHARNLIIDGQVFDRSTYLRCLQGYLGINPLLSSQTPAQTTEDDDDNRWNKLGALASRCMNRVPTIDFMLGPLNIQNQKRRKITRTKDLGQAKEITKPQTLLQSDISKQEEGTPGSVLHVYNILHKVGPINLFEFIINPYHFGQSVENLFYLSFLIRDGKARISMSGDHPMVQTAQPPSSNDYSKGLQKRQLVMELDSYSWARLIEVFNIKKPIIPDRSPSSTLSNGSSRFSF